MIGVLHLITRLDLGGAQENTLDSCVRVDPSRFCSVLLHGPGGELEPDAVRLGIDRIVLPDLVREISPRHDPVALTRIARALGAAAARLKGRGATSVIVHTHGSKAGILGRLAARIAHVGPVVHTIHGFGFHEGQSPARFRTYLELERWASHATDVFVSVSRASLAEAMARGIVRDHPSFVIRSGFDLQPFLAARDRRSAVRSAFGIPDDVELIVSIANLKPQKDPLTLLEAFAKVRSRRPCILWFAGDGELREQVETRSRALGVADSFVLLGWRRDVPDLLAAADVVALSSAFEGLPRSAVQAVAAGRTVVATRVDGTSEILRDGQNGFLVEPRSSDALATGLLRALDRRPIDPQDQVRVRDWDVSVMIRDLERLYESLV